MKKDLAKHIAIVAFQNSASFNKLIPLLKEHCNDEEYKKYRNIIADISGEIGSTILKKIYDEHPDIEADFDQRIKEYDCLIYR